MTFPPQTLRRAITAILLVTLLAWLALRSPQDRQADPRLIQRESLMMGTLVSISVYLDADFPHDKAETALIHVEESLHQFEKQWSAWGDGELGQVNRELAAHHPVKISQALKPLFAQAALAHEQSQGGFDVRVGALVKLWGFDDEAHYLKQPPPQMDIARGLAALKAAPPLSPDQYGPAMVQLDFGAIAKGYAADLAIAQFKQAGIHNAIVNLGGNLRVSGQRGERAWTIGIRHPRPDEHTRILASLKTTGDEAILTSGDYERYFEFAGRRYHHILDPKTGLPAQGLQAVTVVYPQGAWADAGSTALFVAGPQHWRETAARMGITQALVVDAQGQVTVTQALAQRLEFADGIKPVVVP